MHTLSRSLRVSSFAALLCCGAAAFAGDLQTQQPKPFAPSMVPAAVDTSAPAFAPDGNTVFFTQTTNGHSVIVYAERANGAWSEPKTAPFSGQYQDLEPAFSPDGKYIVFATNRPATASGRPLNGNYDGSVHTAGGANLWRVDRDKHGWKQPVPLSPVVNANDAVFSPSIVKDGSLYFMKPSSEGGKFHLYRAQWKHGSYLEAVLVPFSNEAQYGDFDPAVAPDESYIVFSSKRPPAPDGKTDLFLSFHKAGTWTTPVDLRSALSSDVSGTEARLSPDAKTLFFSNGQTSEAANTSAAQPSSHIWQVDMAEVLNHPVGE